MKKKFVTFMLAVVAMLAFVFGFSACGGEGNPLESGGSSTVENGGSSPIESGISFNTLTVEGTKVYGKVRNATTEFSFTNEITVSGNAKYIVALDQNGMQTVITKTIALQEGSNTIYIFETYNDELVNTYTVTIYRLAMYQVTFNTGDDNTVVETQFVEEGGLATEPEAVVRAGYTFKGWEYDFATPITQNTEITASWSANKDTKYTVNYYLQNLDDSKYTLHETVELKGETGTWVTAEIKEYAHFTYNSRYEMIVPSDGYIRGDGGLVLSVYYTRNTYKISVNNSLIGSITRAGEFNYGKEIESTAIPKMGYDFLGWYHGETLLSTDLTYTFTVMQDVTAKFELKAGMSNFNFTSTATTCSITGVKDETVTEIIIPDCVTSIADSAFWRCDSLTSVVIGDGVTSIGSGLFSGCDSLTSVVIGDSVTSIGDGAFADCKLTSVVIPDSVTSIGERAFNSCSSLTSVVIGDGATSIGKGAFEGCDSLTEIVIPDSVTSIGSSAFEDCDSLTSVEIGNGVTSIGSYAFEDCDSLTSVVIGNGVTSIGSYAFYSCSSLTSVVIGDGATSIGDGAFYWCSSLTSVVIPDGVTSIGNNAFFGCDSLTNVVIPDSVTSIGGGAFQYCENLTSVVIPDGVTSIGYSTFSGCDSLTSVIIPDSVTSIGELAFYNCDSLTSITFKDTSTWYRTTSSSDWQNKTGGTSTSVTTPSTNATYFTSTYDDYYWYKL